MVCEHFEGVLKMMHLLTSLVAKLPNLSSEAKNTGTCTTLVHRSLAFTWWFISSAASCISYGIPTTESCPRFSPVSWAVTIIILFQCSSLSAKWIWNRVAVISQMLISGLRFKPKVLDWVTGQFDNYFLCDLGTLNVLPRPLAEDLGSAVYSSCVKLIHHIASQAQPYVTSQLAHCQDQGNPKEVLW